VPQLVSSALAAALVDASEQALDLAGPGLRDTTRIAGSDAGLWVDVVRANAPAVREGLAAVRANLDRLEDVLATGDDPGPAVHDLLVRGAAGRRRIPGRHGGADPHYAGVVVQLLDAPGQLAGLFAVVGMADVNVLDVRMEHALGRPTGLIELLVSADQALALVTALRDAGFDVRS
jgi:prephenate dehydrogenase